MQKMKTMRILISNDDGIQAEGLWALAGELSKIAKVTVAAPDRDQSGIGTAITIRQPLRLHKVTSKVKGVDAYSVEGTPGDSVILALRHALKDSVDMVVAGINEGPNLGNDVFVSGTVGAALQGYFYQIPSLAVSTGAFNSLDFTASAKLTSLLALKVKAGELPSKMMLNINLPNLPVDKLKGIEVTRLGDRSYMDMIDPGHDGKRNYYWIVRGVPQWNVYAGTDIWALEQNKISITLYPDGAASKLSALLKRMAPVLFEELTRTVSK